MSVHASQGFSTYTSARDSTDSEHLPYNVFGGTLNLTQSQSILIMDGKQHMYAHRFLSIWTEISLRLHQLSVRGKENRQSLKCHIHNDT